MSSSYRGGNSLREGSHPAQKCWRQDLNPALPNSKARVLPAGRWARSPGHPIAQSRSPVKAGPPAPGPIASAWACDQGRPRQYIRSSLHQDGACLLHAGLLQVGAGPAELVGVALEVLLREDDDLEQQQKVRPRLMGRRGKSRQWRRRGSGASKEAGGFRPGESQSEHQVGQSWLSRLPAARP